MPHPLFERHRALLERAVQAIHERSYWSAFPESASPKVYGETAAEAGKAEFDSLLNRRFPLTQPATESDGAQQAVQAVQQAQTRALESAFRVADGCCHAPLSSPKHARSAPGDIEECLTSQPPK